MNRICLVGVDSHSILYPTGNDMPVGGEAVQQFLLAQAFKNLGYDVSMVIRAIERDIDELINGIKIISAFRFGTGIPVIRFFHPRATGLFRALKKCDADLYYQSPAGGLTGLTAAFCQMRRRKFIFRVASDVDCIPGKQLIELWRDRKLFEYGLRKSDLVAVQTDYQKQALKQHYGLESVVVNMAMELPKENLNLERDIDVLWISNLKAVKRPDRLLAIAKQLVDIKFTMIGGRNPGDEKYYAEIEQEASRMPNVDFLGRLPYPKVNEYVARTKILVNTSDVEGFPNTFLQAWARKVPVISYFDPDQLILREGLGRRPVTEEEMYSSIRELLDDEQLRERIGRAAHEYVIEKYSPEAAARRYLECCGL